ncbi:RNA polymerase sigma factor [Alcanivorax sp. DP30]|uniref:RNA polymerase sigma factor n=1 Tax=Alcanivorax sp. DP30 TaxID=2606217 RepID=UPI00136D41B9|nr:sigma-70 family RNA polymerase sigma factor [Alcanivorax sp. DP30]MZR63362.1 hypothetical protein [Alcanivorax sp. DP30]
MKIDWPAIVFSEQTQGRIRALCERRFGHTADAEIASDYVLEHLSADDWTQCRKFTGKSRPETFLYTLCSNLVEEYARKKFGRIRPPAWLQQLGDTWLTLWKFICLERQPVPVAIERLAGKDETLRDSHTLTDMVKTIKARLPWCGQQTGDVPLEDYHQESGHGDEDDHSDQGLEPLLLLLHQLVLEEQDVPASAWQEPDTLSALQAAISLTDEQRLILRMAYVDGLKFSAIARSLNLPAHQPARLAQRAVAHIRDVLLSRQLLPEGWQ